MSKSSTNKTSQGTRHSPRPVILKLSPQYCDAHWDALCAGAVPIPRRCPDCKRWMTLGIHDYKDRICRLKDRDSIVVCDVRCRACGATRRLLPPFVVPFRRWGAPVIAASILGDPTGMPFTRIPEEGTIRAWRRAGFSPRSRRTTSTDPEEWIRMSAGRERPCVIVGNVDRIRKCPGRKGLPDG